MQPHPSGQDRTRQYLGEVGQSEESLFEMMKVLIHALEDRDAYTRGHSDRVAELSYLIGQKLGFDKPRLETLRRGSLLHDIGKIGIPDALLHKPGSFSPDERARMNQHPEKGHFLILNCHLLWDLIPMIRNHHENFDGSGYPDGLKGQDIPVEARIVSLSDYFDALVTARPYKKPFTFKDSLDLIQRMVKTKFDPEVVKVFQEVVDPYYRQTFKPDLKSS